MSSRICVDFDNNTLIANFTSIVTNTTITMFPGPILPLVSFQAIDNRDILRICGPLVMLMKHLAINMQASLQTRRMTESEDDAVGEIITNPPEFLVTPLDVNQYIGYTDQMKIVGITGLFTSVIDYNEMSHVAYKNHPGQVEIFPYFKYFHLNVILLMAVSLLCLSCIQCLRFRTLRSVILIIFDYCTLFVNRSLPSTLSVNMWWLRFQLGAWLLALLVYQIHFCNFVLEEKVKSVPTQVIDSWGDLHRHRDVKIMCHELDSIVEFAENHGSEMALSFRQRLRKYNYEDFLNFKLMEIVEALASGEGAYVSNMLSMKFYLMKMYDRARHRHPEFVHMLHISKQGGEHTPYFIIKLSKRRPFDTVKGRKMDQIIARAQQSGLFMMWKQESLKTSHAFEFTEDGDHGELFGFDQITLTHTIDESYILLIGVCVSITVLLIEVLFYYTHRYVNIDFVCRIDVLFHECIYQF